jgi:adenine phosphoribosyltransferase
MNNSKLKKAIREIPNFPKTGVLFFDITTLLADPEAFQETVRQMKEYCAGKKADKIAAIESRGFIFGGALANELGIGLVTMRKPGKLPAETIRQEYDLEYGSDAIEVHADAIQPGDKVVVIDDLVATGGTLEAACKLIEKAGGTVAGIAVLVDLTFLPWREKLKGYDILALVQYDSEKVK